MIPTTYNKEGIGETEKANTYLNSFKIERSTDKEVAKIQVALIPSERTLKIISPNSFKSKPTELRSLLEDMSISESRMISHYGCAAGNLWIALLEAVIIIVVAAALVATTGASFGAAAPFFAFLLIPLLFSGRSLNLAWESQADLDECRKKIVEINENNLCNIQTIHNFMLNEETYQNKLNSISDDEIRSELEKLRKKYQELEWVKPSSPIVVVGSLELP